MWYEKESGVALLDPPGRSYAETAREKTATRPLTPDILRGMGIGVVQEETIYELDPCE